MSKVPRTPPNAFPPDPPVRWVDPSQTIWNIVRPEGRHPLGWNQLRFYGPVSRFHPSLPPPAASDRGSWYAADRIVTALAEVFQHTRVIRVAGHYLCGIRLGRRVRLLDLSARWIIRAGASAALASCEHGRSVAWATALHDAFPGRDGLWWRSAVDPAGYCMVLWENAADALSEAKQPATYYLADRSSAASTAVLARAWRETGWPVTFRWGVGGDRNDVMWP